MKTLIIIPARGGSKGLPGKNLKKIGGYTLLQHAILAAQHAQIDADIVVSTDSEEIAEHATSKGAIVPYLRPAHLATDSALIADVVIDLIERLEARGKVYNNLLLLQPTSPLRTANHIREAYELFIRGQYSSVVSGYSLDKPINTIVFVDGNGNRDTLVNAYGGHQGNRQTVPKAHVLNGAIYIVQIDHFKENRQFMTDQCGLYVMPQAESVDIDTLEDLERAQTLYNLRR